MTLQILSKSEIRLACYMHQPIEDNILLSAVGNVTYPLFSLMQLISSAVDVKGFSTAEHFDYLYQLFDQANNVFQTNLSSKEIELYVGSTLSMSGKSIDEMPELVLVLESMINYEVDQSSHLWVLRERIRYELLGRLSANMNDVERIRELVDILKANSDEFNRRFSELQAMCRI